MNVIIGAAGRVCDGWITTELGTLDMALSQTWEKMFKPGSIDRLLVEHVLEHMFESECRDGLTECYRYLKHGGLLRIAVPDGYRKDEAYLTAVSPPMHGHKVLFTVDTLVSLLESIGFRVTPLEYFDAQGKFHAHPWDEADGHIARSARFDRRVQFKHGDVFYTSLIVDARKE